MVGKLPIDYLMNIIVENEKRFQKEIAVGILMELDNSDIKEVVEVAQTILERRNHETC